MAERTQFRGYLIYSFVISLIIYPVAVRWQWGGGWLFQGGGLPTIYHDFAGSSIVHMVGGVASFWGLEFSVLESENTMPTARPGVIVVFAISFFDNVVKVDDPVGAISVHGVCGAFGTICVGLFARQDAEGIWNQGLFYGGNADQLFTQVLGVLAIAAWVSATSFVLFSTLKRAGMLRVTAEEEVEGLDILEHGSPGYGEGFGSFASISRE